MITNEGRPLENKELGGRGKVPSISSSPKQCSILTMTI
jgi:hypothetical protein